MFFVKKRRPDCSSLLKEGDILVLDRKFIDLTADFVD